MLEAALHRSVADSVEHCEGDSPKEERAVKAVKRMQSFLIMSNKVSVSYKERSSLPLQTTDNMGPGARAVHFSLVFFLAFKAPPWTSFFLRIFHRERGS